ncbi:MAG: hypothetical protein GY859_02620, partial [Desulfobacterales bacterium]|nr:hypothetical protein [Desulfobacterales bacterium]
DAIRNGLAAMEERGVVGVQAALVAVDLNTGGVKAMVGGSDFEESQFNRAVQAKRQPGSAFKPVVYLTALNMGFKPDDMINDQKMVYKINHGRDRWTPRNYNHKYLTRTTIKKALAYSLNAATVNLSKKLGIQNIINTAKDLGIRGKIHPYYSSALGASEVTLLELVSAYAAMARGYAIEPVCFHRIIDKEKMAMVESSGVKERVIGESVSRDMREMLRAVILQGTGRRARELKGEVFGKTGTTNDYVDALFIGFNDNIAVGVWVGRDNHEPIGKNETGARAALPIWIEFMKASEGPPLMPMP